MLLYSYIFQKSTMIEQEKITECPLCGSTNIEHVRREHISKIRGTVYNVPQTICHNCGEIFLGSDSLEIIPGVSTVTSLTNVIDIKSSEWGIEIGTLVDEYDLPDTPSEIASLRSYVDSKEMYRGAIVSEDGTATVILFNILTRIEGKSSNIGTSAVRIEF